MSQADKIAFTAGIAEDGRLTPEAVTETKDRLARWAGKKVTVTVQPYRKIRSLSQNAWYWGVIVPMVAQQLSQGRTFELSEEQTHYILRSAFLGLLETPLGPVPESSTGLTTAEFSEYCEKIIAHAATEWALRIPTPDERWASYA